VYRTEHHNALGRRVSKREIWRKTVERERAERHYKRKKGHWEMKGYDQVRALGPALKENSGKQ